MTNYYQSYNNCIITCIHNSCIIQCLRVKNEEYFALTSQPHIRHRGITIEVTHSSQLNQRRTNQHTFISISITFILTLKIIRNQLHQQGKFKK